MTSSEYTQWLAAHAERHGLTEALLTAAASWERDLSPYPRPLLDRASQRMLADAPRAPDRFGETAAQRHYRLLLAAVAALEGEDQHRQRQAWQDAADRGTCAKCQGSGAVSVPHPRTVRGRSEWGPPWYTCTVVCDCPLGRWKDQNDVFTVKGRDGRLVRMLTLHEYERRVTEHWRELLIERDGRLKEQAAGERRKGDEGELRLDGALEELSRGHGFH